MHLLQKVASRQLFCIEGRKDKNIGVGDLACFCDSCWSEVFSKCENKSHVDPYRNVKLRTEKLVVKSVKNVISIQDEGTSDHEVMIIDETPSKCTKYSKRKSLNTELMELTKR